MDRLTPCQRPIGERVVMRQRWLELLFLHWEADPAELHALLPPGLTLDTFEGKAYIGLVPFTMRDVRPVWSPSVPGLSHFHETNVRTYVHKDGEAPGVWFFSLDAANAIAVWLARTLWRLPYYTATMRLKVEENGMRRYQTHRVDKSSVGGRFDWRPEGEPTPAAPGTLAHFLCERYLLYAYKDSQLWSGQVHHTPYPLQRARLLNQENTLIAEAGISVTGPPPLIHYASGVDVEVFPLRKLITRG